MRALRAASARATTAKRRAIYGPHLQLRAFRRGHGDDHQVGNVKSMSVSPDRHCTVSIGERSRQRLRRLRARPTMRPTRTGCTRPLDRPPMETQEHATAGLPLPWQHDGAANRGSAGGTTAHRGAHADHLGDGGALSLAAAGRAACARHRRHEKAATKSRTRTRTATRRRRGRGRGRGQGQRR